MKHNDMPAGVKTTPDTSSADLRPGSAPAFRNPMHGAAR